MQISNNLKYKKLQTKHHATIGTFTRTENKVEYLKSYN